MRSIVSRGCAGSGRFRFGGGATDTPLSIMASTLLIDQRLRRPRRSPWRGNARSSAAIMSRSIGGTSGYFRVCLLLPRQEQLLRFDAVAAEVIRQRRKPAPPMPSRAGVGADCSNRRSPLRGTKGQSCQGVAVSVDGDPYFPSASGFMSPGFMPPPATAQRYGPALGPTPPAPRPFPSRAAHADRPRRRPGWRD